MSLFNLACLAKRSSSMAKASAIGVRRRGKLAGGDSPFKQGFLMRGQ